MGRKPSPHGKDRPRTIVLCGSVADIAQQLADKNTLSATLSDLLRKEFGMTSALDDKRAALAALTDERKRMQEQEEAMLAELDALEAQAAERNTTLIPALEHRHEMLIARRARLEDEMGRLFDRHSLTRKRNQINEVSDLIKTTVDELHRLRGESQ